MGFLPAIQIRQVSQRSALRCKGRVHKQPPSAAPSVFQLDKVLVFELDGVGGAPLAAIRVSQVDDGGTRHVDKYLYL